jgi:4-hydroxybutyryl-CoA dehydratase/vinylacetyl-CoA-Delta-isomerase
VLTGEDYRRSLDDSRAVFYDGERVQVTEHPIFQRAIQTVVDTYDRYYDPAPGAISAYLKTPASIEEMREHSAMKVDLLTSGSYSSLMTLLTSADRIQGIRPQGSEAIRSYVKEMQAQDLRLVECITDAKGDRARRPGQQEDPDSYLRVVERRSDGVVVRGAKLHITGAPIGHELMTIPTKAMKPGEEDFAIAFSIPVSSPGVKIINVTSEPPGADFLDMPISAGRHDPVGFVIYDNVFVPSERIFLDGEVQAAAAFAHSLGLWVRMNGLKNMANEADRLCGFGQLIAEANGLERVDHIKDKIADLVIHATLIRATLEASIANSEITEDGVVVPDELFANAGKFQAAAYRSAMIQHIQDIAGGSLVTAPSSRDLENPEVGHFVRKYMSTRQSVDGAYRLKLFHALKDQTSGAYAGNQAVAQLHAGGGLFAQRVVTRGRYDMERAKRLALESAGLATDS